MNNRRIILSLVFVLCVIQTFAQTCEDLWDERNRLYLEISQVKDPTVKLEKYRALQRVLNVARERGCGMDKGNKDLAFVNKQIQLLSGNKSEKKATPGCIWPSKAGVYSIPIKKIKEPILDTHPDWMVSCARSQDSIWFDVKENCSSVPRPAIIKILSMGKVKEYRVTQEGAEPYVLVSDSIGFPHCGGEAPIFVETNDPSWSIDNPVKWLKVTRTEYGALIVCDDNPTQKERMAVLTITLASKKLKKKVCVVQHDQKVVFTIPQSAVSFECDGGKGDLVIVESNYGQWLVSTNNDWLTVVRKYGGVLIECAENLEAEDREGIVLVESKVGNATRKIVVKQKGNIPYLNVSKAVYRMAENEWTVTIPINTNINNWTISPAEGNEWCITKKVDSKTAQVTVLKNNSFHQRCDSVIIVGEGMTTNIVFNQLHGGFKRFYKDYYATRLNSFRVDWLNIDVSGLLTIGANLAFVPVRWKPVELSLVNFNVDFFMARNVSCSWEPIVRGYIPITRDGKWTGYVGLGAHVCIVGAWSDFLFEGGAEVKWTENLSSRIFFKYNGACTFGMSLDLGGKWF